MEKTSEKLKVFQKKTTKQKQDFLIYNFRKAVFGLLSMELKNLEILFLNKQYYYEFVLCNFIYESRTYSNRHA